MGRGSTNGDELLYGSARLGSPQGLLNAGEAGREYAVGLLSKIDQIGLSAIDEIQRELEGVRGWARVRGAKPGLDQLYRGLSRAVAKEALEAYADPLYAKVAATEAEISAAAESFEELARKTVAERRPLGRLTFDDAVLGYFRSWNMPSELLEERRDQIIAHPIAELELTPAERSALADFKDPSYPETFARRYLGAMVAECAARSAIFEYEQLFEGTVFEGRSELKEKELSQHLNLTEQHVLTGLSDPHGIDPHASDFKERVFQLAAISLAELSTPRLGEAVNSVTLTAALQGPCNERSFIKAYKG